MQKRLILTVLIFVIDFSVSQHCELAVPPAKENFFTKKLKKWFGFLKKDVEQSTVDDCRNCSSVRPHSQTAIPIERDKRVGCRCKLTSATDKFQCACCFKVWKWDYLICTAAAFFFKSKDVFVILTLEDQVIFKYTISLDSQIANLTAKILTCIPMPPPVEFLSACFRTKVERPSQANNFYWKICGKLKLGFFQVPVIRLYMKCFNIKDSHDEMLIDGQLNPSVDVPDPATAEVTDDSYNSIVCLSNTKKQEALNCNAPSSRQTGACVKPVRIEVRNKINWVESKLGETPYLVVLHQKSYPVPVHDVKEDDPFPFVEAAMKIAGDQKWMDPSDQSAFQQPGRSCGGALLTPNKLLTICACIRSFYILNKMKMEPAEDVIFPYDIQSVDIFVDIPGISYTASEDHRLDTDATKFMSKSLCAKYIASNETWVLQTIMMVMPFTPEIKNSDPRQFVSWPPMKVQAGQAVTMVTIGMELRNQSWLFKTASGRTINFEKTSVNFFLKQCDLTDYSKFETQKGKKIIFDSFGRASGFCSANQGWQLCYGKIGFPLTAGGKLVGLSSLPVDCAAEGSIAGAIFDQVTVIQIEQFLQNSTSVIDKFSKLNFLLIALTMDL